MKLRTIFTLALVIFVCVTTAYLVWDAVRTKSAARDAENKQVTIGTQEQVSSPAPSRGVTNSAKEPDTLLDKPPLTVREQSAVSVSRQSAGTAANKQHLASGPSRGRKPKTAGLVPQEAAAVNSRLDRQTGVSKVFTKPEPAPSQKVIAYYFHGTKRCPTCLKMEAYADEAIKSGFSEAMKQGGLEWRVVNTDEPANKHFLSDYQLYTKALVIVKVQDGKQTEWKNLEKIWDLVGEKDDFIKYVQEEIGSYLGARK